MRFICYLVVFAAMSISLNNAFGQDSLIFKNGNTIKGEIKGMDRGVLTIETDYSKNDFTIEWVDIKEIYTKTQFLMTLTNGDRLVGTLAMDSSEIRIKTEDNRSYDYPLNNIVTLNTVEDSFWDRMHASLSLGYSLTKAQNLKQITLRSHFSYVTERWVSDLSFNNLTSTQDDAPRVERRDGGMSFNYFLPKDWYVPVSITFLSNTEQKIKLRLLGKIGIGKYAIHTNKAYLGFSAGANANFENFEDEIEGKTSWEAFVGTELNLFDTGDLSLLTRAVAYPSLTESGRMRVDFTFDAKYDLPLDFFIQAGLTVNYDNRPVEGAPESDYVFQATFGWSWN